jgi:hypothetical protein
MRNALCLLVSVSLPLIGCTSAPSNDGSNSANVVGGPVGDAVCNGASAFGVGNCTADGYIVNIALTNLKESDWYHLDFDGVCEGRVTGGGFVYRVSIDGGSGPCGEGDADHIDDAKDFFFAGGTPPKHATVTFINMATCDTAYGLCGYDATDVPQQQFNVIDFDLSSLPLQNLSLGQQYVPDPARGVSKPLNVRTANLVCDYVRGTCSLATGS